jgi:hypothetical protein
MTIFCNVLPLETTLRFDLLPHQISFNSKTRLFRQYVNHYTVSFFRFLNQGVGLPAVGGQRCALPSWGWHSAFDAEGPSFLPRLDVIELHPQSLNLWHSFQTTEQVGTSPPCSGPQCNVRLRRAHKGNV